MAVSEGLVEQHIHGCFGIDFMTCSADDIIDAAKLLAEHGVTAFFPAVMTAELSIIKERIYVIKKAMDIKPEKWAQIAGVHLEGPFINPEKAGIHQKEFLQPLDIDIYKQIEDEAVKIITLAPELDKKGSFIRYLKKKGVKISAGHTVSTDLSKVQQVTHLYNAMGSFHHRNPSTALSALLNDDIYTEIIADSMHVSDDAMRLAFKLKPAEKILLISDALPLAGSKKTECIFAGQKIYKKDGRLVNEEGTLAGSSMLLYEIVKNLADKGILSLNAAVKAASANLLKYHNLENRLKVHWNKKNEIEAAEFLPFN